MDKYGLIGFPLGHSFSRGFFTEKFAREGIDAEYVNFEIPDASMLLDVIRDNPGLRGLNVTLPHKQAVIPLLDELSDEITPVMAGLSMFCKFDKPEFIGKEALLKQKTEGPKQRVIGIELADRAIPRHGYDVLFEGEKIGEVTTGYNSISTGKSVCMALVDAAHAKLGTEVAIQIRKKTFPGVVVKKKFYDKHYKK